MMTKQSRLFSSLLVVLLLMQTACRTDTQTQEASTTEVKPLTVHTRTQAEPDRLSPILTTRNWSLRTVNHLFLTLLEYDPYSLELVPVLAKSLPKEEAVTEGPYKGETAYIFEIHDEAVWDDGKPITGNDYVFTMKALFNPLITQGAPAYRAMLGVIKDVEVDVSNPKKFTVYTEGKYIRSMYATGFYIYPEHLYDPEGLLKDVVLTDLTNGEKAKKMAEENPKLDAFAKQFTSAEYTRDPDFISGSGAYKLEEWVPNERVILKKKENWWGDQLADRYSYLTAKPDRIVFHPVKDALAALSLLRSGEVDFVGRIPGELFDELKKDEAFLKDFDIHTPKTTVYNYLGMNNKSPKLSDKRVRKALAYAVNTDEIVNTVKFGLAQKIASPVPTFLPYCHKGLKPYELDLEKSKALLDEAGWKDTNGNGVVDKMIKGKLVEMNLEYNLTPKNIDSGKFARIIKEGAGKVGINIELVTKEANLIMKSLRGGTYELIVMGAGPDLGLYDPKQRWYSSSGGNYFGFGDEESDALIDEIRSELDQEKLHALYKEFQELLYEEVPVVFLYNSTDCIAVSKRLKNFKPSIKSPAIFEHYLGDDSKNTKVSEK